MRPSWITTRAVLAPTGRCHRRRLSASSTARPFTSDRKRTRLHRRVTFDFDHTVHGLVLGTGLDIYVHDHDSLRTKAAKEDTTAARERGQVPMSRADYARAEDAYQAVMNHPAAAPSTP